MRLFDEKFYKHKARYIAQCLLATLSLFIILAVLDTVSDAAVAASLGASCFIVFLLPETKSSGPRFIIGGHIVGVMSGYIFHLISTIPLIASLPYVEQYPDLIFGSLTVGLSMFLMVITDTEHPPAAGMALGLILNGFNLSTVIVVFIGIFSLSIIKYILKPFLKNLL